MKAGKVDTETYCLIDINEDPEVLDQVYEEIVSALKIKGYLGAYLPG